MLKLLADFVMRGRLQAIGAIVAIALLSLKLPPLSLLTLAVISLVTLRVGAKEGLIILLSAGVAAFVPAIFLASNYAMVVPLNATLAWLPVWLIAIVLREGRHLSLAMEAAILIGMLGVIGYYLYVSDPAPLWRQILPRMILPGSPAEKVREMLEIIPPYMTGIAATLSVFGMVLGVLLGRWWQALLYNPGGFRQEFLSCRGSSWTAIAVIVLVVAGFLGFGKLSEIAWNLAFIFSVYYILIGIAVLHSVFAKMNLANFAVPMFYITLVLIKEIALPLVAVVGLADTWLNIRKLNLKQS